MPNTVVLYSFAECSLHKDNWTTGVSWDRIPATLLPVKPYACKAASPRESAFYFSQRAICFKRVCSGGERVQKKEISSSEQIY